MEGEVWELEDVSDDVGEVVDQADGEGGGDT